MPARPAAPPPALRSGSGLLAEAAAARAQFLVRLNANRRPPVLSHLPDGSVTSLIGGVKVRIITAVIGSGPPPAPFRAGSVTSRPRSSSPCPAYSRCRAAAFRSSTPAPS
jgi:hypothetical protein